MKKLIILFALLIITSFAFADTTPPVTTFSSFQVPNTTDQNITLTCTDNSNSCKQINYNIDNTGLNTIYLLPKLPDTNTIGLISWWKMNETSGTVVIDYNNFDQNGTNNGSIQINQPGIPNNSYYFNNSTSQYINFVSNPLDLNKGGTISAWIKTSVNSPTNNVIYNVGPTNGCNPSNLLFGIVNRKLFSAIGCSNPFYANNYNLDDNQWHFVSLIIDTNRQATLRIDGVDANTISPTIFTSNQSIGTGNEQIGLGYYSGTRRDPFLGFINNVSTWNRPVFKKYDLNSPIYSFLYTGLGDHNIQYFSTDNSDNTETIKTSNFTTYGAGKFTFRDENTYALVSTNYNVYPSINGVSSGTGTTLDLNFQGITNQTYTFTFSKTGYGTRYYYTDLNEFSSFDYNQLMLQDTNGNNEIELTIYTYTGTAILPNTPITITKNNYLVGRYLTDSTGTINPFLKDQDVNYLFNIDGYYSLGQVAILFNRPKWDTNLGDIVGTWQITLTSPQSTTRYLITTNSQKIAILPNTVEDYSAKVCMYGVSNCNTAYISRTFLLSYKGNLGETSIQPYLNLVSASTLRTLKVLNYGTAQPYPDAKLEIRTKTETGVDYLVESVITDSTGLATTYLNDVQTYYMTANDVTVYNVTPNDTVTTYYIYFNYINLPSSTITPIDVNTSNDTNTLIGQVYGVRNALFTSCTLQNDCFPAVFFSILITFLILISVTNMTQANNPVGIKGLALVAFCSLTIFFGIGWLPVYIYAFLGAISMLLVVVVQ